MKTKDTKRYESTNKSIISMNLQCIKNNWQFRINTILDEVVKINPNIISFQEVCVNSNDDMISFLKDGLLKRGYNLKNTNKLFTHMAWDIHQEFLVTFSRDEIQDVIQDVMNGQLPSSPLQRGFISINIDGTWYINTHLEHRVDYYNYRQSQIDFLITKFNKTNHIIMGDFNSSPENSEQQMFHNYEYTSYFPGVTHPTPNPEFAIDGFWISKNLMTKIKTVNSKRLFVLPVDNTFLSDHFGVLANIIYKDCSL